MSQSKKNNLFAGTRIIDISVPTGTQIPSWPKIHRFQSRNIYSIKRGDTANDTEIKMSVHTGTHVDAPLHFVGNGKSVDNLPLNLFMGEAVVIHLSRVKEIAATDSESIKIPKDIKRILFKTSNSEFWKGGEKKFKKNYVALNTSAAKWLVKHRIKLVGVDYLSIAKFEEAAEVHRILLGNETVLLEGIDLSKVRPGVYNLICLPVKLTGIEAAPLRAVLISKRAWSKRAFSA